MREVLPKDQRHSFGQPQQPISGAVLLEVVLALALFVGAAVVISTGLSRSSAEVDRLRLRTHALNLALSVLSEIQMGIRPAQSAGPEPFPAPFQEWSSKVDVEPLDQSGPDPLLTAPVARAHIVVRHEEPVIVQELTEIIPLAANASDNTSAPSLTPVPSSAPSSPARSSSSRPPRRP